MNDPRSEIMQNIAISICIQISGATHTLHAKRTSYSHPSTDPKFHPFRVCKMKIKPAKQQQQNQLSKQAGCYGCKNMCVVDRCHCSVGERRHGRDVGRYAIFIHSFV